MGVSGGYGAYESTRPGSVRRDGKLRFFLFVFLVFSAVQSPGSITVLCLKKRKRECAFELDVSVSAPTRLLDLRPQAGSIALRVEASG